MNFTVKKLSTTFCMLAACIYAFPYECAVSEVYLQCTEIRAKRAVCVWRKYFSSQTVGWSRLAVDLLIVQVSAVHKG